MYGPPQHPSPAVGRWPPVRKTVAMSAPDIEAVHASGARRLVPGLLGICGAAVAYIVVAWLPLVTKPGWDISSFRGFFAADQLSYLAIAADAAAGRLDAVEPFTLTGSNFYPRWYYVAVGLLARGMGISVGGAWTALGMAMQLGVVVVIATALVVVSGRAWAALFAVTPFVVGTLAVPVSGSWLTSLESHAVLWGPFAVLFPLNAEAAGLCIAASALVLAVIATVRLSGGRQIAAAVAASAAIGFLANVQTYSFFTALYIGAYAVAAVGIARSRRPWPWVGASVVLVVGLVVVGGTLADVLEPLAMLAAGLLPALVGIGLAARAIPGIALGCAVALAAAASPRVIATAAGITSDDEFLVYRVASSVDLGVPATSALIAALPLVPVLLAIAVVGLVRRDPLLSGAPLGAGAAWVLLTFNDHWGANQEPYRMWIDGFTIIALVLPVLGALAIRTWCSQSKPLRWRTGMASALAVIALLPAAISVVDWMAFTFYVREDLPLISLGGPRSDAMAAAGADREGLVLTDPCIDPIAFKIASAEPVAYYNLGLAWPAEHEAVQTLLLDRLRDGDLSVDAAAKAGVTRVVTDAACEIDWTEEYAEMLVDPASFPYGPTDDERFEVWTFIGGSGPTAD